MTTYTANLAFPKPEGTDLISQGFDAIDDLADAVDAHLTARPAATQHVFHASGSLAAATIAGAKKILIECWAAGGGGGTAAASTAGNSSAGGGGGGGGYARRLLPVAGTVFPLAVTVPGAAAAGANGGNAQVADNAATVLCRALGGGAGGALANGATVGQGVGGGAGGTADVADTWSGGGDGFRVNRYTATAVMGGQGGPAGGGGGGGGNEGGTAAGGAGAFPGGGGGGGKAVNGAAAAAGGTGGQGKVLITAFY